MNEILEYELAPTSEPPSAMVRGALKVEITTSTALVSAGKEFSIYVVIHNPFDVPITLHRTETHIPVELSDEIARGQVKQKALLARHEELGQITTFRKRISTRLQFFLADMRTYGRRDFGERVAEAVGVEYKREASTISTYVHLDQDATVHGDVIGRDKLNLDFSEMSQERIRQILWDINQYSQGKTPVILQPGNSIVRHFVLKTTSWLMFTPLAHTFQIQVTYDVGGSYQTDTIPFAVNIQASMRSSLIGAVIGSILGSFVKSPPVNLSSPEIGRTLLTSAIFAVIIVVAFARKSNVQQIVSVEDFWGGIFIGFLTGYSGESFIGSVLGSG